MTVLLNDRVNTELMYSWKMRLQTDQHVNRKRKNDMKNLLTQQKTKEIKSQNLPF